MGRSTIFKGTEEEDTRYWCEQIVLHLRNKKLSSLTLQELEDLKAMPEKKKEKFLRTPNSQIESLMEPSSKGTKDGKQFGRWLKAGSSRGQAMTHDALQSFVVKARRRGLLPPLKQGGLILKKYVEDRIALGEEKPQTRLKAKTALTDKVFQARALAISALREYALALKEASHLTVFDVYLEASQGKAIGKVAGKTSSISKRATSTTELEKLPVDGRHDDFDSSNYVPEVYGSDLELMARRIEQQHISLSDLAYPVEWCKTGAVMARKSNKAKTAVQRRK